jgi:hypothetical protein
MSKKLKQNVRVHLNIIRIHEVVSGKSELLCGLRKKKIKINAKIRFFIRHLFIFFAQAT